MYRTQTAAPTKKDTIYFRYIQRRELKTIKRVKLFFIFPTDGSNLKPLFVYIFFRSRHFVRKVSFRYFLFVSYFFFSVWKFISLQRRYIVWVNDRFKCDSSNINISYLSHWVFFLNKEILLFVVAHETKGL